MSGDLPGLTSFAHSIAEYEARMRDALGGMLVKKDLVAKHEALRKDAFKFLRGTCWRWAEAAPLLCPDLIDAPRVPSVGDAHAQNFGIWRDAQSRLVWGINDYDEAARLPWGLDLVRLCTSAMLAVPEWRPRAIAECVLDGYRKALGKPAPFVLERQHLWLRDAFTQHSRKREKFWKDLEGDRRARDVPALLAKALRDAAPAAGLTPRITARQAGVGSLGRPRFVAVYDHHGAPAAFEIKARLPSCWDQGGTSDLPQRIARGRYRSPDPALHYAADYVIRRHAPDSQKVELNAVRGADLSELLTVMGAELAAVHAETDAIAEAVRRDLRRRKPRWLHTAAERVADWTIDEHDKYAKRTRQGG